MAENQVLSQTVYRGMTVGDAAGVEQGLGITAKAPNGLWTAEEHVLNISRRQKAVLGGASQNDPWIGTTQNYKVADAYRHGPSGTDTGNGIVAINLGKVPAQNQVEVWRDIDRSTITGKLAFNRSFWAQEVSVYQHIPQEALYTPFNPLSQISVSQPMTYGLTIGGTGFADNRGGSQ